MRIRGVQLIVVMAAALLLGTGVAIADALTCKAGIICVGSSADDTITGTFNADTIKGLEGNDTINASSGNDTVEGGDDNDTISGAYGDDKIFGGNGDDKMLDGSFNNDTIDGGPGDDTINGGPNRDTIKGGTGSDKIRGDSETDNLDAADGEVDNISCGTGTDTLKADEYADGTPLDKNSNGTPLTPASSSCETITWVTLPLEIKPLTVNFGASCPGNPFPVQKNVTLKNVSTSPINLSPSITGANADNFSAPTSSIDLAPGASAEVTVTFMPQGDSGTRTGSLYIKDASKTVGIVSLSGEVKCAV